MPEKPIPQPAEADEIAAVDYAYWDVPGEAAKVIYSLPLFHEIDFVVNEGYRKIPHGGIEVGGLLFGTIERDAVRIEAFRPIECEHSSGPSLHLSERDLAALQKQISEAASDKELSKFQPVGWFLAHTRGPLELTDNEAKQFDKFFPQPLSLTVLIKPERFQPTRFGFLVRKATNEMPREATNIAVILPLPGRAHKTGLLVASIPAPAPVKRPPPTPPPVVPKQAATRKTIQPAEFDEEERAPEPVPARPSKTNAPVEPLSIWKLPPDADITESETESIQEKEEAEADVPEPAADFRTAEDKAKRRQLARDRARVMEEAYPAPAAPSTAAPFTAAPFTAAPPFRPSALPSLPANATRPQPAVYSAPPYVPTGYPLPGHAVDRYQGRSTVAASILTQHSLTALALAALLGCLVGYIGYLQLPAPVIPLDVRAVNQTIVVSWPPDETRNSIYAAIRFNDGAPVPLSPEERNAGQVSLAAAKDFKLEVMARNWVRDVRGIVRYMHSANGNGTVVPQATLP